MAAINTTCVPMTGGVAAVAAVGEDYQFTFGGAWATGDKWTVSLTDGSSGVVRQVGAGEVSGVVPNFAFTYANKVYVLSASTVYFSAVGNATIWNDPNATGDSFVTMSNWWAAPENLSAIAPYQGRLAFFSRRSCQIWIIAANPASWQLVQLLANIGTLAPASVQALGDLDVLFLSDTGIRSLRVRDSSLNAYVNDIGSPVDDFVQTNLSGGTPTSNSTACSVVEPSSNRYWLYLNGVIYVLSYFPSSKIIAWSTYSPTYNGDANTFVPQKFVVYNGQVYVLATSGGNTVVLQYGGSSNAALDACTATLQTPFLDAKTPGTEKQSTGIEVACTGSWTVSACMNIYNPTDFVTVVTDSVPSFDKGRVPFNDRGTHFSLMATTTDTLAGGPTLSSLIWHYEIEEEK